MSCMPGCGRSKHHRGNCVAKPILLRYRMVQVGYFAQLDDLSYRTLVSVNDGKPLEPNKIRRYVTVAQESNHAR